MKTLFFTLLIGLFFVSPSNGQAFYSESGKAEFLSLVTSQFSFTGTSQKLVGKVSIPDSTVDFYLDLTTIETGIGKRDKDMLMTLEAEKYPFAEFFGKMISPFDPLSKETQEVTVSGVFKIHGVERPLVLAGKLTVTEEGLHVTANWKINIQNYDIVPPSILKYKVQNVMAISIDTWLEPQS